MFDGELDNYLVNFESGEKLIEEGEWGNVLFLIKKGNVEVVKQIDGGEEPLTTIGKHEIVGEMSMFLEESDRTASVRALNDVECWKFFERQLKKVLNNSETFRTKLIEILTSRIKKTTNRLTKAMKNEKLFYNASLMAMKLYNEQETPLNQTVELSPDIDSYPSKFGWDPEHLTNLLANPGPEQLKELNTDVQRKLRSLAEDILTKLGGRIEFSTPYRNIRENVRQYYEQEGIELEDDLNQVKQLVQTFEEAKPNGYRNISREQFREAWTLYNRLDRLLKKIDPDNLAEPTLYSKIENNLPQLKTHLDQYDLDQEQLS